MILPFRTAIVKGIALTKLLKCVIAVVKPFAGYPKHTAMARSYGVLKPGKGKIDVFLKNHSVKQVTLQSRLQ